MSAPRRIALLIEATCAYDRGVLAGVARFARTKGNWTFAIDLRRPWHQATTKLASGCHGVIVNPSHPDHIRLAKSLSLPTVNVGECALDPAPFPLVSYDQQAIGQLAADHLLQTGLKRFASVGHLHVPCCDRREEAFNQKIRAAGHPCDSLKIDMACTSPMVEITKWLSTIHTPIGVFACDDLIAREVLEAARTVHLDAPEEIAVLGVDNDSLISALSTPSLSSVRVPAMTVGQLAAELLDQLMDGKPAPQQPTRVEPIGVAARLSSDALMIADTQVVKAVRFIRDHANQPLQVGDVLENIAMSRRSLERRFREYLGRSPQEEIQRVHLERAKSLLADSDMPIAQIATESGFRNSDRLAAVFRSALGLTPSDYRARFRDR